MSVSPFLLAAFLSMPAAEISTIDDRTVAGAVTAIDANAVTIESDGRSTIVPLDSILEVRLTAEGDASPDHGDVTLRLKDGGRLQCEQVVMKDRAIVADTVSAGQAEFPLAAVQAILFRPADAAVEDAWNQLVESAPERDLLVVRNGDVLDRLDGTISGLDAENLTFLVGETRVPIPRSKPKLFGIIPGKSPPAAQKSVCEVRFRNSDRLSASEVSLEGGTLKLTTAASKALSVPVEGVASLDFGRDKIQLLSQLEPRDKRHTPYFDISAFDVQIDENADKKPIRIGGQTFRTGLVIHSKTSLTWRLNGEYRRFVAVAGIEDTVRQVSSGADVLLSITADGKELLRREVKGPDAPLPLDLDVTGARELTVLVDFAERLDIADHLALGDAKLIK